MGNAMNGMGIEDVLGFTPDYGIHGGPVKGGPERYDGAERVAKLRVRATVRVVKAQWCEVALQIRLDGDSPWLDLTPADSPVLVARRFSGKDGTREAMELYAVWTLRQALEANGAVVLELAGSECRPGNGVNEWRYWAHLGARLSVAIQAQADNTVAVLGLD